MKETLLIAWREYKQYVFSRGFLLLLVLAPIGLLLMGGLINFIGNNIPQRHYVIIDQSDLYEKDIDIYMEQLYARRLIQAWDQYVRLAANIPLLDQETLPTPYAPAPITQERLEAFTKAGGVEKAKAVIKPYLKNAMIPFEAPKRRYIRQSLPPEINISAPYEDIITQLRPYLTGDNTYPDTEDVFLFAALIIPRGFGEGDDVHAEYWSRNLTDTSLQDHFSNGLNTALQKQTAIRLGVDDMIYQTIRSERASLSIFRPDRTTDDAELNIKDRVETGLPAIMSYTLFILIFSVGSLLLTNTIEERSNKIVEMLLSSVTANQLMMGKLIGIGAFGLTIPAIGLLFMVGAASTVMAGNEVIQQLIASLIFSPLVWVYLFYFLCGYVIFAMMYLAIGAISNSLQDAQTFLGPVTLVVMAPLPLMVMVFQDPNGLIASIMTWIPIYTPYAVMLRAASDPPLWEIIGATAFMLIFGIFFVTIMGRIFRQGLLQTAPPSLKYLFRLAQRRDR